MALIAALGFILYAAIPANAASHIDYDADDDGLIEIDSIAKLQAIRWDHNGNGGIASNVSTTDGANYALAFPNATVHNDPPSSDTSAPMNTTTPRMGCPAACIGYELTQNLDFAAAPTSSRNWTNGYNYQAIFEGNGFTISNMTNSDNSNGGLFGVLTTGSNNQAGDVGRIRNLGLINPTVTGRVQVGPLAGETHAGTSITASWVSGGTTTRGGADATVNIGAMVGRNGGSIIAAWSSGNLSGSQTEGLNAGGLVGENRSGIITASYASGRVNISTTHPSTNNVGALVGQSEQSGARITNSYCSATVSGSTSTACVADNVSPTVLTNVARVTTAQLQTPTAYTGIFANWNVDLDGDTYFDNPWNFGTSSDLPAILNPSLRTVDHDADNDNLIDVDTLHKLNAIRYDLNGDGEPDSGSNYAAYARAFLGGDVAATTSLRMGCTAGCQGYELTDDLNFDADGVGGVSATDPYPNWPPIGTNYAAVFDGGGHTISNLTINNAGQAGLFGRLSRAAVFRDIGIINASVTSSGPFVGVLSPHSDGIITAVYVAGGSVVATGAGNITAGGLVGSNAGTIRASYSTASVNVASATTPVVGGLIGLDSYSVGSTPLPSTIAASYAAGPVSATTGTYVGGFIGLSSAGTTIIDSYCDTTVHSTATPCAGSGPATVEGKTATELKSPTSYTGIYQNWNINLNTGGTTTPSYPWYFGTTADYPTLNTPAQRLTQRTGITPPDSGNGGGSNGGNGGDTGGNGGDTGGSGGSNGGDTAPPPAPPATVTAIETIETYNAETAHPEIYTNPQYQMTATCQTHNPHPDTGDPTSATLTFNLGTYDGPVLLVLSIWRNQRYMAYETQDIPLPTLNRQGQTATVRVDTDPVQTRFRLDGRRNGLPANLVLGYADCHTDGGP